MSRLLMIAFLLQAQVPHIPIEPSNQKPVILCIDSTANWIVVSGQRPIRTNSNCPADMKAWLIK